MCMLLKRATPIRSGKSDDPSSEIVGELLLLLPLVLAGSCTSVVQDTIFAIKRTEKSSLTAPNDSKPYGQSAQEVNSGRYNGLER